MLHLCDSNDILSYMEPKETVKPHLIVMVGIPRSGKSFFAEHFAEAFKAPIISFDQLRKEIFTNPSYDKDEDEIINRVADSVLEELFKTKRTIIYEGQSGLRVDRMAISKTAQKAGYETLFIWVQTELSEAKKRALRSSSEQPAMDEETFDLKVKNFTAPAKTEKAVVISGKHPFVNQLKIVLKHLIQPQAETERTHMARTPKSRNYLIR